MSEDVLLRLFCELGEKKRRKTAIYRRRLRNETENNQKSPSEMSRKHGTASDGSCRRNDNEPIPIVTGHKCSCVIDRFSFGGHCSTAINYVYKLVCVGWVESKKKKEKKKKKNKKKERERRTREKIRPKRERERETVERTQ